MTAGCLTGYSTSASAPVPSGFCLPFSDTSLPFFSSQTPHADTLFLDLYTRRGLSCLCLHENVLLPAWKALRGPPLLLGEFLFIFQWPISKLLSSEVLPLTSRPERKSVSSSTFPKHLLPLPALGQDSEEGSTLNVPTPLLPGGHTWKCWLSPLSPLELLSRVSEPLRHLVDTTSSNLSPLPPGASVTSQVSRMFSSTELLLPDHWIVIELPVSPASLLHNHGSSLEVQQVCRQALELQASPTLLCRVLWCDSIWGHSHSILCLIKEKKVTKDCPTGSPVTSSTFDLKIKYHLYFYLPSKITNP